jgi:protein O-GlcNAc transferase
MLRADAQFAAAEDAFRLCTGARAVAAGAAVEGGQGGDSHALQGASPTYVAYAHNEYGHLLTQIGRGKEAARQWRAAVAVDPQFAQGWVNVAGDADLDESIHAYRNALRLQPSLIEAWINLAQVYYNNFRKNETYLEQALQTFARAREVAPHSTCALYSYVRTSVDLCRWHDWEASFRRVESAMASDLARGSLLSSSISLVYLLIYPIADELILSAFAAKAAAVRETARGVADTLSPAILNFRHHVSSHSQREAPRGEEVGVASKGEEMGGRARKGAGAGAGKGCLETEVLVIGYVSADYREHPVSLLFQNVPRFHDPCQFRVVCFSLHSPRETAAGDRMRLLLRQNAHRFVDLDGLNLAQAAGAIAAEGVHVLVDMNGYTQNARPELFAIFSPSDVLSVSLLGFASSLMPHPSAALASDRVTSPPELLRDYSERLVYLPDSFYLADHTRSLLTL